MIAPEKQLTIIQSQSSSFRNAFNNDGTFLENFKKVTETKIDENDDEVIKWFVSWVVEERDNFF